jgi:hypothetical protein
MSEENTKPVGFPLARPGEDFQQACRIICTAEELKEAYCELDDPGNSPLVDAFLILAGEAFIYLAREDGKTYDDLSDFLCRKGMSEDVAKLLVPYVAKFWEAKAPDLLQWLILADSGQPVPEDANKKLMALLASIGICSGQPFTRADLWAITKFLAGPVVVVLLGYYFFFAPPDLRCENSEIQTLARKLFVVYFDEISKPQTQSERVASSPSYGKPGIEAAIKTVMNTEKVKHTSADSVKFDSIETILTPDDDVPGSGIGSKIQYVCSAMARFQLPPELAARLDDKHEISAILERHGNEIGMGVIYTTEADLDGSTKVGIRYQHPLMDVTLKALFRTDLEEAPKAPESTESPGATDSQ